MTNQPIVTDEQLEALRKERIVLRTTKYAALTVRQMENWTAKQRFALHDVDGAESSIFGSPIRQAAAIQRANPDPMALKAVTMEKEHQAMVDAGFEAVDKQQKKAARFVFGGMALYMTGLMAAACSSLTLGLAAMGAGYALSQVLGGRALEQSRQTGERNEENRKRGLEELRKYQNEICFYRSLTPWLDAHFVIATRQSEAEWRANRRKAEAAWNANKGIGGKFRRIMKKTKLDLVF